MQLTISKKLYGLGLLGLLFTLAAGITGAWGITRVAGGIDDVSRLSTVIRNHIQASMFLDWSRTDISKMLTTTGDSQATAASELESHKQLFGERLDAARSFAKDPESRAALDKEAQLASAYISDASKIAALRAKPAEAAPLIGGFLNGYQDLRNMMDSTTDQLEARSKRAEAQANTVVSRSRLSIVVFCVASSILLFVIAFGTARQINRRLADIIRNLKCMAAGDLTHKAADGLKDELGEMTQWLNDSMEKLRSTIGHVATSAQSVTAAVEGLNTVSQQMSADSEETSSQASVVSSSTEQVTSSLQTVASSTEQMSSSIKEIAKSIGEAAQVAGDAVRMAQATNKTVSKLGDSSSEIGNVIKVIMSIAQQTNLLALNATIEAARAGDAGKGFAVVAHEVKELANQTAKATEDISRKIEAIQQHTSESVSAIARISDIIAQINDISRSIAASIEEQNTTTNEIARNISQGARGSEEIANNISGVAQAAQNTSLGARNVQKAAEELRGMSSGLTRLVGQFKYVDADAADGQNGQNGDEPGLEVAAHSTGFRHARV
jgi:methyl-accepting chemotaxis protein